MFGGGGMNPRKMEQLMDQMGIEMDELDASRVRIELAEGTDLVFENPEVTRMDAQGQQTYQVVGEPETREAAEPTETEAAGIPAADVEIVAERAGVDEDTAREALEASEGDLAAAIASLE
ncbi:MAG: nascent polypeptide-associated complex protein [Halodesulfurarchaeum sp.]